MSHPIIKTLSAIFNILSVLFIIPVVIRVLVFFYNEIGLLLTIVYLFVAMWVYGLLNSIQSISRAMMNVIGFLLFGGVYTIWYGSKYEFPELIFTSTLLAVLFNLLGEYLNYLWMKKEGKGQFYGKKYPEI